ncbi:hypothetical protein BS50DRAFT_12541 [Corynespora cassiicola Philippines]|uniref:Xylanolytic transcriptional activator regulatory domain-containing protein n=1 Tax=Corynespora cassiicola Philippines TaxID=1448308 RepID=A0A2T2P9E1_CORCC|nr:hypothetical protein BS50DRAFT_12541 [Corynespora cassiicola Philippines]
MELDHAPGRSRHSESQASMQSVPQRVQAPVMNNFDHVRRNIHNHSQGIFDTPHTPRHTPADAGAGLPDMPSRADFAHLSRSYLDSFHESYPVLHWPTFQHEVDQIYTARSFEGMSREWIGLFFAVLACGSLQMPALSVGSPKGPNGRVLFDIANQAMMAWPVEFNLIHAKVALLLSIFATESGLKSAGSMWLASAVRIAQGLGLNTEADSQPIMEGEMRRRLWWSIYVRDRVLSLGLNCSMLINEDDCDISLPTAVEDRYIQPQGFFRARNTPLQFTGFVAVTQVTRLFAQIYQTLKSSVISPQSLQTFDEKFRSKLLLLPESHRPESDLPLEPAALSPLLTLQFARFHLYRRNLSPACRSAERTEALGRCVAVAQDTAKYISRTLHPTASPSDSEKNWQIKIAQMASNMMSLHIWRCILVLCLRGDYDGALICLKLASAIDGVRDVNISCGKHLLFFLDQLTDRIRIGNGSPHQLEHDEEMLAYASGDLQSSLEHSWAWATAEGVAGATSPQTSPTNGNPARGSPESMHGNLTLRPTPGSPDDKEGDWAGWGRVGHIVRQLKDEHRSRQAQPPSYYPPPHNPVKRVQLASDAPPVSPSKPHPVPSPAPSSTSRISIANII